LFDLIQKALFVSNVPKHSKSVGDITTGMLLKDIAEFSKVNSTSGRCCLPWVE
jgi:hypothetical protein